MEFITVAETFQHIKALSKRTEITIALAHLFQKSSPQEAEAITYLSLGSLMAPYHEAVIGIAEKSVMKVIADLFNLSPHDISRLVKTHGDIGDIIAQGSWSAQKNLSVLEVYHTLTELTTFKGTGSQEKKLAHFTTLLYTVSPIEAACISQIVLGKLRLGFSDMTIIDALSWMIAGDKSLHEHIEQKYNTCADLGLIAQTLAAQGIEGLEDMTIRVGIPIRPAAAERLEDPEELFKKLGPCIAQPKIDGFRLQIHMEKPKGSQPRIWFFSRNLIDMSAQFPDLASALLQHDTIGNVIIEGEAICFDEQGKAFLPFQETVKRKRKHDIAEVAHQMPLTLFIFDIMFLNNRSCLDLPHTQRRALLKEFFTHIHSDKIVLIEEKTIRSAQDVLTYFQAEVQKGLEGIMVKRTDAIYQPGKRNFNWIKLKRTEETGGLADSIDTVIVGYYAGRGKRAKLGIGAFLVALYDKEHDQFVTVAKIGTGLSDEQWHEMKKRFDSYAAPSQPHNVVCDKALIPDVWITPEIVCAVRADTITKSPLHTAGAHGEKGGYALRFPRFISLRSDKKATDANTVQDIMHLYSLIQHHHLTSS